jgi:hypothetical protein
MLESHARQYTLLLIFLDATQPYMSVQVCVIIQPALHWQLPLETVSN